VYLFGSYARNEEERESDIDVLKVLDEIPSYGNEIERTGHLASGLSLQYGVTIPVIRLNCCSAGARSNSRQARRCGDDRTGSRVPGGGTSVRWRQVMNPADLPPTYAFPWHGDRVPVR
jgi:hypothetical protein